MFVFFSTETFVSHIYKTTIKEKALLDETEDSQRWLNVFVVVIVTLFVCGGPEMKNSRHSMNSVVSLHIVKKTFKIPSCLHVFLQSAAIVETDPSNGTRCQLCVFSNLKICSEANLLTSAENR